MAKHNPSHKSRRPVYYEPATSDETGFIQGGTVGAYAPPVDATWSAKDSTNTKPIDQEDDEKTLYSRAPIEFVEKLLGGRVSLELRPLFLLITILWFGFVSWLFLRDNELGRLLDCNGIIWFVNKAGIYSIFYLLVLVIIVISSLKRKSKQEPNNSQ